MIRVLIAANSPVVRAGLEAVVASSGTLEFVRSISLDELESAVGEITTDVLLAEISNLEEDWISTLAETSIPAVILTDVADPAVIAASLRSGVRSLLSRDASAIEIAAAIQSAAAGLAAVQPAMLELIVDPRPMPAKLEEPLSPRELEVLALMGEGLSNKLIAYRLGISEHTVKFHVTSIMGKLHAGSRTDAVMQGIRRGLLMI